MSVGLAWCWQAQALAKLDRDQSIKIGHLIEHCGYLPKQIAAVTFTNKAAREMKERVAHSIGKEKSKGLIVSTFHTLGFDIIKREYKALGLNPI